MKRVFLLPLIFYLSIQVADAKYFHPKILHLSFHQGCINDFKQVADELGLDLTIASGMSAMHKASCGS